MTLESILAKRNQTAEFRKQQRDAATKAAKDANKAARAAKQAANKVCSRLCSFVTVRNIRAGFDPICLNQCRNCAI